MINKGEKGITLMTLTITIILLIIIAGIVISSSLSQTQSSKDAKYIADLEMIYNAILQRYTKASLTKETLPGIKATSGDVAEMKTVTGTDITDEANYYKLEPESGLKDLGVTNVSDTFIVNYKEGEVFNLTKKKTEGGRILYISNK